jgi:hypothetical protein
MNMTTKPALPECDLHSRVLQRIEDGRLPVALSNNIYAGYGQEVQCDLCDQPIAPDAVEYDVDDPRGGKSMHFHSACHSAWQQECALRLTDLPAPATQT